MSTTLPVNVLRYGRAAPPPGMIPLRAGPLRLLFVNGDLRAITLHQHEVVQRIYVAVRDHNWGTVPAVLRDLMIQCRPDSFQITYTATHHEDKIDFVWHGAITGAPDGTLTFAMNGSAQSTFMKNRIGICVLHGSAECAGLPCTVEHADGTLEHGTFPTLVTPHQPFLDMQAITHEVAPGVHAALRFAGEVWEMEDQRNWTDASFKTYCTPLALPFPVMIAAGTTVQQTVTLALHRTPNKAVTIVGDTVDPVTTVELEQHPTEHTFPQLGLSMASHGMPLTAHEVERVCALKLAHLRADCDLAQPDAAQTLQRASEEAAALGIPLELALHLTSVDDPAMLERMLYVYRPEIGRWLLFNRAKGVTHEASVAAITPVLRRYAPMAPIGGGTNANFAELNRHRPATHLLDYMSYSINPQVHAFDDLSVMENLGAQADTVASACSFSNGLPLVIGPVTLRPRFNAAATGAERIVDHDLPSPVDSRQSSLFAAAWTVGSLKYLAESGVAGATYYETTGWRGIMETERGSLLPARFHSRPAALFPVYHVFAALAPFAHAHVLPLRSNNPLRCAGLALRKGEDTRVLLANLSPEAQPLHVVGLQPAAQVAILDETCAEYAMFVPEVWPALAQQRRTHHNTLALTLRPYALVVIDQPA
jgi:hypothetical protein